MTYLYLFLTCAAAVGLDQLSKYLVNAHIPLYENVPLIPGIIHLTNVRNTGAAFSMLEGRQGFFLLITLVFLAAVIYCVVKKVFTGKYLWILTFITAGAIGNLIDRMLHGYVVDMFEPDFIRFAVFNVADIYITLGAIALCIYVLFIDRDSAPETETTAAAAAEAAEAAEDDSSL